MTNFQTARDALETSLNSSGSAMREHEKWSQSLEARLNKLKSTWQSLSQSFMNSDFLKGALDGIIGLVNGLDKLIDTVGTLPTLLGLAAGGLSAFKNKGLLTFDKDAKSIQLFNSSFKDLGGEFKRISTGISTYNSTLTKSKGLQDAYVGSINRHNSSFGKYLSGLNGAKASMGGYIASLVGAKVASFALQAATIALNAAITMGVSFLISGAISLIQKWINAKEELAERVDEVTAKFKEQHTELVKNQSSFESQAKRYSQLAKGVNDLGENVSLTADEYAEYQDIVNSIANQVPSLIQGYDAQGNAILNYKGNVEELTAAYEDLIKKQNDSVLKGDTYKDIEKDFKNAMEDAKSGDGGFMKTKASLNEINALEALLKSNNLDELIPKLNEKYGANISYLINELESAGIDKMKVGESYDEFIKRAVTQNKDIVQRVVNDFNANLDAEAEGMRTAAQAALSKAFDFSDSEYKNISDKTQSLIRQIVGNFDAEQFDKIVESGKTVEEYINSIINSFKNMSKGEASTLEAVFDLKTQFNGGNISYGEYVKGLQDASDLIDDLGLDKEIASQIKMTLGLSLNENDEWVLEEYETLLNRLTSKEYDIQLDTDSAENFLKNLSASEVQVAVDFIESDNADFKSALQNYKDVFDEAKEAGVDFSKTVFGNIDTNARQTLEWTSGNLKKYKDELMSWEPKDASWDKVKKEYEGAISTVMGTVSSYEIDGKEVDIAFSPMLQTDKGAEILSSGTVDTYINELISKATEDGKWDKKELIALDAKGLEVDGQKIKGILADIGKTAEATSMQMHFVGKDGALALAEAEINAIVEKQARLNEAMNFTIAMDVETESIEALNTAMAESVSGAGLSSEAIAALKSRYAELEGEGYNLSAMFEETANGIHLNREAVSELEQKLASNKLAETDKQLDVLKGRYDELTTEIRNCTDASERAALYTEQQSIVDKINDLGTLASQYKGLTSAYNAWKAVEEAGSERDMYEGIIEGFETVGDEIKRGWVDDGTIKFLELLTGKTDLASKSGKQLKEIYDSLDTTIKYKDKNGKVIENTGYSISDFFTVDDDGNSTNTGVYNFLDAIGKLEEEAFKGLDVVKRDGKGNIIGFDFELVAQKDENGNVIKNGDQVIAEALGISEELVQIMVRASDDAGFVVNLEGAYTQLADLKTEAEAARDTLISLQSKGLAKLKGVDVNFNLDAEGDDLVAEQEKAVKLLDKFKKGGKIDLKMEGAQQALDIAEYLTIKLDDLTEPKIMQIDVSEVDEDLRDPIEKMQEIVKLSKEKNLVSLTGDKKEIKETQNEINKVAKELEELDPEIKAQVGIDENWDAETIASKIEKGEVEIPAELELDVQMSDDLKDMRLMMMNQLGLASDEEVKLKVGFDIDESLVDTLDDKKQKIVLEYITENEEEFNKLTEKEKEVVVKLIADGVDLDNYEVEDKEAVVNYIANGEEADGWTPEAKDAFVKYLADGGEIDKFDPKNKESWVVYETDTTKPDGYEPDDEDATVTYDKDSSVPDGYDPDDPTATVTYNKDSKNVDNYNPPSFTRFVKFIASLILPESVKNALAKIGITLADGTANAEGTAFVDGTAFARGTTGRAFKQGYWGTKDSGVALGNELGMETIVRDGHYFTIGDGNAQFFKYKKGDIIFNHKQTEELFKHGKVTSGGGHGKVYANGTAFSGGSGGGLGVKAKKTTKTTKTKETTTTTTTSSGSSGSGGLGKVSGKSAKSKSSSKSKSKEVKDDFEETFDWIEVKISRLERAIDRLDKKANGTWRSWTSRNKALTSEISKVNEEINLQEKAYDKYMAAANATGLSSKWKKKVRDGSLDISTVKDEALAEKIKDYQTYYEKALECKDTVLELKDTEAELNKQKFDNIVSKYDAKIGVIDNNKSLIEQNIEQSQYTTSVSKIKGGNYKKLVAQEQNAITQLEAKKKGLQAQLDKSVKNGSITKYSEDWYAMREEIYATTLAIKESTTNVSKYYSEAFDQINSKYDGILQGYEHTETMLNEYIAQAEAQGYIVSDKYYKKLISNEKSNIKQLKKQQADLVAARDEALKSGAITKNSAEWYRMSQEIDNVTQEIESGTTALIEYNNALKDIEWEKFDLKIQGISDVNEESDFLIELLSNKDLYDDKGKLTGQGAATLGLHGLNHNTYMYAADEYAKEIADIDRRTKLSESDKDYLDPNSKDVIDRRRELVQLQRESILAAEGEKKAIQDLVQEGIDKELDALQELIDKKKESLQSEKDLYDYQRKISQQTKNIASLEKQLASYSNDTSEESQATIQKLKVELEEAKTDLESNQYDKYISDQEKLLDSLYSEYESIINQRLDNIDGLLEQVVAGVNAGMGSEGAIATALGNEGAIALAVASAIGENGSIKSILNTELSAVGSGLSQAMSDIWGAEGSGTNAILATYGQGFQDKLTTTNTTLDGIKIAIDNMVSKSDEEAQKDISGDGTPPSSQNPPKTEDPPKNNPPKNNDPPKTNPPKTQDPPKTSGDGKAKVGDKVKFISGKYYASSDGQKPTGTKNQGKQVYITKINTASWATHPYHISTGKKLGSGDLGWLKLKQLKGYAVGKKNFLDDEIAWTQEKGQEFIVRPSDGAILTPVAKGDSVLNATASGNIWSMANNPAEFIKNNLGLDNANVPNGANVNNTYTQHLENVTFSFPNVHSYDEMLKQMQKDKSFEKLIMAMTIDRVVGKSALAKGKAIR